MDATSAADASCGRAAAASLLAAGRAAGTTPASPVSMEAAESTSDEVPSPEADAADTSTVLATVASAEAPACDSLVSARASMEADAAAASDDLPPVQVCIRLRKVLGWEQAEGHESTVLEVQDGAGGQVSMKPREGDEGGTRQRNFRFDAVFGPERTQQDVWNQARLSTLVGKVVRGFHATVFAYGQTGSGKTHTMEGFAWENQNGAGENKPSVAGARPRVRMRTTAPDQLGIVPRAISELFSRLDSQGLKADSEAKSDSFLVKVSFLQIYKERIYDLLNPVHTAAQRESGRGDEVAGLRLRWDAPRRQFFAENLFEYECSSAEDVMQHYHAGVQNKHMASTTMNVASSRSHTVLVLTLVRRTAISHHSVDGPAKEVVSKLALVDLAGSERAAASGTREVGAAESKGGTRFQEAVNINQSLFVLRKVITALSRRAEGKGCNSEGGTLHVPYRESKLTSLLQHAIGGNSFLLMLACLSPADRHYEENLSTLHYASQASSIKNEPVINLDPKDRLIQQLQNQLAAAHAYILRVQGLDELPADLLEAEATAAMAGGPLRQRPRRKGDATPRGSVPTVSCMPASARGAPVPGRCSASTAAAKPKDMQGSCTAEGRELFGAADALIEGEDQQCSIEGGGPPGAWTTPRGSVGSSRGPPPGKRNSNSRRLPSCGRPMAVSEYATADLLMAALSSADAAAAAATNGGCGNFSRDSSPSGEAWPFRTRPQRPPSLPPPWHNQSGPGTAGSKEGLPPLASASLHRNSLGDSRGSLYTEALVRAPSGAHPRRGGSHARSPRGGTAQSPRNSHKSKDAPPASAASVSTVSSTPTTTASNSVAVNDGLWEAVEELKQTKGSLEEQLRASESRAQALQEKLRSVQPAPDDAWRTPTPERTASDAARISGLEEELKRIRVENDEYMAAAAAAELEQARLRADFRELSLASGSFDAERAQLMEEFHALEAAAVEAGSAQGRLACANEDLKKQNASLQERLEFFERAMALETSTSGDDAGGGGEAARAPSRLAEKCERYHSQLLLEAIELRKEVASLRKKKWVMRSVMAKGGEAEQCALDQEIAELRKSPKRSSMPAPAAATAPPPEPPPVTRRFVSLSGAPLRGPPG
eukprot:gnl/TRDRNA2_/TRDRNA2_184233_c0_seq1.p1 gnl/TRDRNA2_/TRDRNA2_184233_c0~~gnl/TRDRNA2_/TRDRNA2_184233_c0_seq1.p1  ORF type:complete len:1112 (+),score=246.06 gnl/TRDRNA2_/TRDRNA2_184233_c0_seq1:41-3376(+)